MPEFGVILEWIKGILPEITTVKLLWTLLPAALLVPFITFFLGRIGTNAERKLEYRTFLHIDEVTANYKLKNMPAIKSRTKLFTPTGFQELETEIARRVKEKGLDPNTLDLSYLKVQSFGKSIITGGSMSIKLKSEDGTLEWDLDVSIPILDVNEEIYIPLDRMDKMDIKYHIAEILINYRTQSGEKMRYKSVRKQNLGRTIVRNTYSVKKFNLFFWSIDKNKGKNVGWIFLDKD